MKDFLRLGYLDPNHEKIFLNAVNSDWQGFPFAHYWESLANKNFERYMDLLPGFAQGKNLPEGHVPCTFLFAFNSNEEIVGRVSIRHELTDALLKDGGHIGYAVVPKFRRNGIATKILELALKYVATELTDIDKVLLTCDEGNIGSQKTIEKNGGELQDILDLEDGKKKRRYWIELNQ